MDEQRLRSYAEIIVKNGVNLYKGQCANIIAGPDDLGFALILEETLYRLGAKYVDLVIASNVSLKSRITHSRPEDLAFLPSSVQARINEQIAHDFAYIRIDNTGENGLLTAVDPAGLDTVFKAARTARKRHMEVCCKHERTWCVVAAPDPWGAAAVLKDAPPAEAEKRLDAVLTSILRLDRPDPAAAWRDHAKTLTDRACALNALGLDRLRFTNSTSDLTVGLTPRSRFEGGGDVTPDGRAFLPNIPTEEVFTTPDYRRTEGTVRCTRPVTVMETELLGVWFRFEAGKVVDFGADNNRAVLENFVNTDDGARFLGEVALVDRSSPVYQSNVVFGSILYDENASCHIALGNGYPSCLEGGETLRSDVELKAAGCNTSLVHEDFMIGSDDLRVTGIDATGTETVIIDDGYFVL
jgi:aminopeptidase